MSEKPPLGIMPWKLHNEVRLNDLIDAMTRYRTQNYIIPAEWFEEAAWLSKWLEAFRDPTELHYHPSLAFLKTQQPTEQETR